MRERSRAFVASEKTRNYADLLFEVVQDMDRGVPYWQRAKLLARLAKAMERQ